MNLALSETQQGEVVIEALAVYKRYNTGRIVVQAVQKDTFIEVQTSSGTGEEKGTQR